MDVHFVRGGPSYLPELAAYATWLAQRGHHPFIHATHDEVPADAPVVWSMCGRVARDAARRLNRAFHVHEYASASVPPVAWGKDRIKQWTHPRPHHRVFQSEWVRRRTGFDGSVPFSLRDMGVPSSFLEANAGAPAEFDLVYLGETSRLAAFEPAFRALDRAGLTLLVVGAIDPGVQDLLGGLRNVHCTGRVPQEQVPSQVLRARGGLNFVPGTLPFTEQTSTKALEYLALGLPVVSNDYAWIRRLAAEHPGRVRALASFDESSWTRAVRDLPPRAEDRSHLAHLTWEARLEGLPVWDAIDRWAAGR
jgi:glycosyltransferase involved in cell wall biosynthesis